MSTEAHDANEATGNARPLPPRLPELVSTSLEREREGQSTVDGADDGRSRGVVDDTSDVVHDPGGRTEQPAAQTNGPAPCQHETADDRLPEGSERSNVSSASDKRTDTTVNLSSRTTGVRAEAGGSAPGEVP
ncbi:hypothetical protein JVT61DRAFT_8664 [Boletus reticuloceps]|uniref:Uncharacterized protein n=1 Tax=Boletus reticuloceps TaxID=495285 RepID=A0A8I2YYM4_9AGAM|nr:hypothetical protein JVT61DRAFT_8664 [Boletus reticuloceps]